ncbi:MAG: VIT1/CCC1 transporter family protein [Rhodobacteraceae bacterium]|nr:VIT1/CCC1 transporter family protein [Paracoccaceae bacterium]
MSKTTPTSLAIHKSTEHKIGKLQEFMKQIVFGGNDGIVTTFAIVAGFAGAGMEGTAQIGAIAVLLFGVANLLADATAMGLGEFLSARSEQDVYKATRDKELYEIHNNIEMERAEMYEILADHGMSREDAVQLTEVFERNPEFMADFMMQYEIGMSDPSGDSPAMNGLMTFLAFIVFGVVPLLPYFLFTADSSTFYMSVFATLAALIALGLLRWKVTNETVLRCVGETVLVGGICAVVAFGVGKVFS